MKLLPILAAAALTLTVAGAARAQGVPNNAVSYRSTKDGVVATGMQGVLMATVPAGRRLVVTNASCEAQITAPTQIREAYLSSASPHKYHGRLQTQAYGLTYIDFGAGAIFRANESPVFWLSAIGGSGSMQVLDCTLVGYLQADN